MSPNDRVIDNLIGTKEIVQETPEQWSQAIAKAKPRFRKGSERVREKFGDVRRGSGEVEKGMDWI